jgi:hypothetical protein
MGANRQLSPRTNNGYPTANPRSFPDPDPAALGNALLPNWLSYIVIRVIVVYNEDRLPDKYVTL